MFHTRRFALASCLLAPVALLASCSDPEVTIEQVGGDVGSFDGFGELDGAADADVGGADVAADAADAAADVADAAVDVQPDVDPNACEWQVVQTIQNPTSGSSFGSALASLGDRLAIGETGNNGRGGVTIYERGGDGAWSFVERIDASDSIEQSFYGTALALNEDTLVVGSGQLRGGAVYVYEDNGAGFSEAVRIAAPEDVDRFGTAVALRGDVAYVGAPGAGLVFEVDGSSGTWGEPLDITAGSAQFLGRAMSNDGEALAVGGNNTARVYIQEGRARVSVPLDTTELGEREELGASVLASGDSVFVGAPGGSLDDAIGGVFVYEGAGRDWTNTQRLSASDAGEEDAFGSSMARSGDVLAVGASARIGSFGRDAVYLFERGDDGVWTEVHRVDTPEGGSNFGHTVVAVGETFLVSDPEPRNEQRGSGRVHVVACE